MWDYTWAIDHATSAANHLTDGSEAIVNSRRLPKIGLILGTGWGDVLRLEESRQMSIAELARRMVLKAPDELQGHRRIIECGTLAGNQVIALRGRVHLNEHPTDPAVPLWVRLQVEMLLALGVKTFILTNAAGALEKRANVGDVVIADGFVTVFAPPMPLFAGEFFSPEDLLTSEGGIQLAEVALSAAKESRLTARKGAYAMMRGPFFEGRAYDKRFIAMAGATVVGMSTLPEACVIATKKETRALCVSFVTNSDSEEHSHEENLMRAKISAQQLSNFLTRIVSRI